MNKPAIIMAAPNGARKTHRDHLALPVSIPETVSEALSCYNAGASVLHAHVRGQNDEHVLDAGLYRELTAELKARVPGLLIQITTEAVGIYTPQQQVDTVKSVRPEMASVSIREMTSNYNELDFARDFYHWAEDMDVHIQHILYSADDLEQFLILKNKNIIPTSQRCALFVLGRYAIDFQSSPADLEPFLKTSLEQLDWFVCAFGSQEQACVSSAIARGGHARVGFENNLFLANGEIASSTAELVAELVKETQKNGIEIADSNQARALLGVRSA